MRKTTNTVALALALLFFAISAFAEQPTREFKGSFEPANNGERLLSLLVSLTDPESMELRMDQQPDNDGNIRDFSIFIQGASIGGFRVEKIAIESSFLELNRPSEWRTGERDSLKVRNVLRSNVELVALEKDINAALTSYAGGDWRRISVDLKKGMVSARGNYRSGSLDILAEVRSREDASVRRILDDRGFVEFGQPNTSSSARDPIACRVSGSRRPGCASG